MCCFSTILSALVSRIALIVWWLTDPQRFNLAFKGWLQPGLALPAWVWAVLGGIFLPWTTLAYLYVSPGGVVGFEWIVILLGLLIDLAGHGGGYYHRNRFPRRRR